MTEINTKLVSFAYSFIFSPYFKTSKFVQNSSKTVGKPHMG